jgi:glutathione S-transferase
VGAGGCENAGAEDVQSFSTPLSALALTPAPAALTAMAALYAVLVLLAGAVLAALRGGATPVDAALVDAALAAEGDAFAAVGCAKYRERHGFAALGGETLAAVELALRDEVVPRHLAQLERALAASGWIAGTDRPSAADFAWGTSLRDLRAGAHSAFLPKEILTGLPRVNAFLDRFLQLPEVASYYTKHP